MEKKIDMTLRIEVLEMALGLEKSLNDVIKALLTVQIDSLKAFGNKSGSLSFKNKLDILNDLGFLTGAEYKDFILFMEFRNQFMHNYDCNTFTDCVATLGNDRQKQLLNFKDQGHSAEIEDQLQDSFRSLNIALLSILLGKFEKMNLTVKDYFSNLSSCEEYASKLIDATFNVYTSADDKFREIDVENPARSIAHFEVISFIGQKLKEIAGDPDLQDSLRKFNIVLGQEKLPPVVRLLTRKTKNIPD